MIEQEDIDRLLSCASKTLLPALTSRPGQLDLVACSSAGGQFVLVQIDEVCNVEEHSHPYEEFCLVLRGRITTWIGEKEIDSLPGDFVYEPANIPHRARIQGPYTAIDFFAGHRFDTEKPDIKKKGEL